MRRTAVAILMISSALFAGAPANAGVGADHRVLMSDFRFCNQRPFPCDPLDVGYVPNPAAGNAAVVAVYSPITEVIAKPGDTVTFIYDEGLCANGVFCPPHTVTLVDGSYSSADTKTQGATIVYTVPLSAKLGSTIPFFCKYHVDTGMTGAIGVS